VRSPDGRVFMRSLLLWLAATCPTAADEKVESVVSGTVTIQMIPTTQSGDQTAAPAAETGQVVVRFGPKKTTSEPDDLERCGKSWNDRFVAHTKKLLKAKETGAALRGRSEKPLTRMQYREHMYGCLEPSTGSAGAAGQPRPDGS
jgi:hypothetical protein